jgi:hypothetical protein
VSDLIESTGLTKRQVERAIQHHMAKGRVISKKDKYSGFRGKGKIAYYTLSHEIYSKLG